MYHVVGGLSILSSGIHNELPPVIERGATLGSIRVMTTPPTVSCDKQHTNRHINNKMASDISKKRLIANFSCKIIVISIILI